MVPINWGNWCKKTFGSAMRLIQYSLRNKNCMTLFATEKFASLHAGHTHKSLPLQQHHSSHLNQQVTGNTGGDNSFENHSSILRTQDLLRQSFKF